jgi:hypothetical protein
MAYLMRFHSSISKGAVMTNASLTGLRIVLVLAGAIIIFTGINVAFGGMRTLGWQGDISFFEVTNEHAFLVHDSHIRFLGGLWLGVGTLFIIASTNLRKYRSALIFAFALIFLGGIARFSQMHFEITFGPEILGSLLAELVGMPLLYLWLSKAVSVDK